MTSNEDSRRENEQNQLFSKWMVLKTYPHFVNISYGNTHLHEEKLNTVHTLQKSGADYATALLLLLVTLLFCLILILS